MRVFDIICSRREQQSPPLIVTFVPLTEEDLEGVAGRSQPSFVNDLAL